MSARKHIIKQAGTSADRTALQAVPAATAAPVRTDTQNQLWAVLKARSDGTSAELAIAAGIGRSTAGKILAEWAKDGTVTRTPGGRANGRRTPDRWTIPTTADMTLPRDDSANQDADKEDSANEKSATPGPKDRPTVEVAAAPAVSDQPDDTSEGTEGTDRPDPADQTATDGQAEPVPDTPPSGSAATDTASDGAVERGHEEPRRDDPVPGVKPPRLQSGALRGLVEDFLREHPSDAFGPGAIGKALSRSAGAVNNALEKLVVTGYAQRVQDAPKRFQLTASSPESPMT